jgi:hypothetical protein
MLDMRYFMCMGAISERPRSVWSSPGIYGCPCDHRLLPSSRTESQPSTTKSPLERDLERSGTSGGRFAILVKPKDSGMALYTTRERVTVQQWEERVFAHTLCSTFSSVTFSFRFTDTTLTIDTETALDDFSRSTELQKRKEGII